MQGILHFPYTQPGIGWIRIGGRREVCATSHESSGCTLSEAQICGDRTVQDFCFRRIRYPRAKRAAPSRLRVPGSGTVAL